MKRIHYLLLGLLLSLCIAAVSPTLPPTRIIAGTNVTVVTNGVNNFTLAASGGVGTSNGLATNLFVYSSGTTNWPLRVFGTNGTSEKLYIDKNADIHKGGGNLIFYNDSAEGTTTVGYFQASNGRFNLVGALEVDGLAGIAFAENYGLQSYLVPDAANVLAMRNAANANTFRVYYSYTDANNYQRAALTNTSSSIALVAETAGTGADNIDIQLTPAGTGGIIVGSGGTAIKKVLSASAALNFDLTALVVEDLTITVTGAADGDVVSVGVPNGSVTATVQYSGWVSAADTVTVRARTSVVGEDPASGTFRVMVTKF